MKNSNARLDTPIWLWGLPLTGLLAGSLFGALVAAASYADLDPAGPMVFGILFGGAFGLIFGLSGTAFAVLARLLAVRANSAFPVWTALGAALGVAVGWVGFLLWVASSGTGDLSIRTGQDIATLTAAVISIGAAFVGVWLTERRHIPARSHAGLPRTRLGNP